jgi:hypothetical protein
MKVLPITILICTLSINTFAEPAEVIFDTSQLNSSQECFLKYVTDSALKFENTNFYLYQMQMFDELVNQNKMDLFVSVIDLLFSVLPDYTKKYCFLNPLHWVVSNENIFYLLASRYPVLINATDKTEHSESNSPFHTAVSNGNINIVKYLLSRNVDLNYQNEHLAIKDTYAADEISIPINLISITKSKEMISYLKSIGIPDVCDFTERNLTVICNDSNVNLRDGPSTNYNIIRQVSKGESAKLLAITYFADFSVGKKHGNAYSHRWVKVKIGNDTGWIFMDYLNFPEYFLGI